MRITQPLLPLLLAAVAVGCSTGRPQPLAPVVPRSPSEPPPEPPAIEPVTPRPEARGVLRPRDIAAGERRDSLVLAEQRAKQREKAAGRQQWWSLDSMRVHHTVLYRWREVRGGLPLGARVEVAEMIWPSRGTVIALSDTAVRLRLDPVRTDRFGALEWQGGRGHLTLEVVLRPASHQEWLRVEIVPAGPAGGEASDRFRDRLRSLGIQMPLMLNAWTLRSRTQTVLELPSQ